MTWPLQNRNQLLIGAIILLAVLTRLYNLTGHDLIGDDALYSFRSIGYLDYVAAINRQSTPVTWFSEPQWWQSLSFHDHPPLVFLIQWLFFKIGGVNLWSARLPFVLAGILSILTLYFLGKSLFNPAVGLLTALTLTVSNYGIWISRIGFLDGYLVLWIILTIYFFLKAKTQPRYYLWWMMALAAGLLTKYTFLFILPVFLIFSWRRKIYQERWFYYGLILFLILISPVIIYNFMMWQTRGHFDAAISTMIGQSPKDFQGLTREINREINVFSAVKNILADNFSIGFQILIAVGLILWIKNLFLDRAKRELSAIILFGFALAAIILSLVGGGNRFGAIILPFISLIIAYGVYRASQLSPNWSRPLMAPTVIIFTWELIFGIQSQLIPAPIINYKLFLSPNFPPRLGYKQLESYVADFYRFFPGKPTINLYTEAPQLAKYQDKIIRRISGKNPELPPYKHLLVYDDRLLWFPAVWIFERRYLYEAMPIHSLSQFLNILQGSGFNFYTRFGLEDVTIITPTDYAPQNEIVTGRKNLESFINDLTKQTQPLSEIIGPNNQPIFKIYRLPLI